MDANDKKPTDNWLSCHHEPELAPAGASIIPPPGFDSSVDVDKLRQCVRMYHEHLQIGIPAGVVGSAAFVDVVAAGRLGSDRDSRICASYTTRSTAGPRVVGSTCDGTHTVLVSSDYASVMTP